MVLYTPLIEMEIFPPENNVAREYVKYRGQMIQVRQLQSGEYEIEQLVSTNPNHYLMKAFNPGRIIS